MVAIKGAAIDRFVARPDPDISAVLIYGPDCGLVSERSRALLGVFARNPDDPFAVSILDEAELAKSPGLLADELGAIAFGGERRTVIVRSAAGTPPASIAEAVSGPREARLLVEAGDLKPSSPVRKAFEAAKDAAALPCYADNDASLGALVDGSLKDMRQTITRDAKTHLLTRLGSDRLASRAEIEKLMLFAGEGAEITLADIDEATADAGELTLDALVDAVGEGNPGEIELALERAAEAGMAAAQILSAAIRHFLRLHECLAAMDRGTSPKQAASALRPPVYFLRSGSFARQLQRWSEPNARQALELLAQAEVEGRIGHAPWAAASRILLRLALLPRGRR